MEFEKVFDVIREMNREGVDYIMFGAVALNLHGVVRATTDADFFIRADRDNVERLKRALRKVWDDPHIEEISADDLLGDYPSVAYGPPDEAFSFDFLTRLGEVYSYDNLPSQVVEYEGIPIRVVTVETLHEMKMNTVRPHDKVDAMRLRELYPELGE
ncbi:MAG TPA: hypothetical protein VFO89_04095 [Thermoanaerobaculia bacterium]|nr:hypothetical protein [Thermoanaerobaculia bacterium]